MPRTDLSTNHLLSAIHIRLYAIATGKYASHKMEKQAAFDALDDLKIVLERYDKEADDGKRQEVL